MRAPPPESGWGAKFVCVGIADVLDMYLGQSEQNLKGYFEAARRQAPCVLFFDEVDALGRKRSLTRHSAASGVISQFLAELDGMQADNRGVFVLAATNHPWDVDAALRGLAVSLDSACCSCFRPTHPHARRFCGHTAATARSRPTSTSRPSRHGSTTTRAPTSHTCAKERRSSRWKSRSLRRR